MVGKCEDGASDKILNIDGLYGKKDVKFWKWYKENKNMKKIEMAVKCGEDIETWISSFLNLKQRVHRIRIQVFYLNSIKKDWQRKFHVDSNESYKNANQD